MLFSVCMSPFTDSNNFFKVLWSILQFLEILHHFCNSQTEAAWIYTPPPFILLPHFPAYFFKMKQMAYVSVSLYLTIQHALGFRFSSSSFHSISLKKTGSFLRLILVLVVKLIKFTSSYTHGRDRWWIDSDKYRHSLRTLNFQDFRIIWS